MVSLVDIDEHNWLEVISLSVAETQRRFVATAVGILARAYALRRCNAQACAISADGTLVGLLMVRDLDEPPACYELQQLLVDQRYQNRGYGQQALALVLERLAAERRYDCVEVCVHREDSAALHLYQKAGFADTGYIDPDLPDFRNWRYDFS